MKSKSSIVLVALVFSTTLRAHHSVPVNFDQSREISITGVLTEVAWRNPHSHLRLDITTENGSTVEWLVELGSANAMRRAGYPLERFAVGDPIEIIGWPGRRDRTVYLTEAILDDGTVLECGSGRCSPRSTDDRIEYEINGNEN